MVGGGFPLFTGLIEAIGRVNGIRKGNGLYVMSVSSTEISPQVRLGQSVAVSGACLTVSSFSEACFDVDLTQETMERTRFSEVKVGQQVNLERALSLSSRLDGHIVTGHVDGVAIMTEKRSIGSSIWATFCVPENLLRYVVMKGSIALDGVSLTVAEKDGSLVSVALIPTTISGTTLKNISVGDKVNLEVDIIGRYVESLFGSSGEGDTVVKNKGITMSMLNEMGW